MLCAFCVKLHHTPCLKALNDVPYFLGPGYGYSLLGRSPSLSLTSPEPKCRREDYYRQLHLYFYPRFSFDRIQMALKQARLGQDWRRYIDDISYSDDELENENETHWRQGRNNWFLFQHRIINDEMYIRAQQWFLVPPHKPESIWNVRIGNVCGHIGASKLYADHNRLRKLLICKVGHWLTNEPPCYSVCQTDLVSCKHCPTEASIDIKAFPDRIALVLTKWARIGPGLSRDDRSWSSRLRRGEPEQLDGERAHLEAVARYRSPAAAEAFRTAVYGYGNRRFVYEEGSIRAMFGTGDADARSRLSLAPKHQKDMLDVVSL